MLSLYFGKYLFFELNPALTRDLVRGADLARMLALDLNIINSFNIPIAQITPYLANNILIGQCLSSAAYLSKSTREYVLSMMLSPLTEEEKAAMDVKDEE